MINKDEIIELINNSEIFIELAPDVVGRHSHLWSIHDNPIWEDKLVFTSLKWKEDYRDYKSAETQPPYYMGIAGTCSICVIEDSHSP